MKTTYTAEFKSGVTKTRKSANDYNYAFACTITSGSSRGYTAYGFSANRENAEKTARREISLRDATGDIEIIPVTVK